VSFLNTICRWRCMLRNSEVSRSSIPADRAGVFISRHATAAAGLSSYDLPRSEVSTHSDDVTSGTEGQGHGLVPQGRGTLSHTLLGLTQKSGIGTKPVKQIIASFARPVHLVHSEVLHDGKNQIVQCGFKSENGEKGRCRNLDHKSGRAYPSKHVHTALNHLRFARPVPLQDYGGFRVGGHLLKWTVSELQKVRN
jgi:hypothetical protein